MMKGIKAACKKLTLSALALLALLSYLHIVTSGSEEDIPIDASCPYTIHINGVNYIYPGGAQREELSDEDVDIIGKVRRKSVPLYRMPEKNGQSNFGAAGAPYGVAPDGGYVFFYEGCWRPLIAEDDW